MNYGFAAYNGLDGMNLTKWGIILGVAIAVITFIRCMGISRTVFFIFFILLIGFGVTRHRMLGRIIFPWPHQESMLEYSEQYQLDPYLVAAVTFVESGFDERSVSRKGAIGLMQVMPETGRWIGEQLGTEIKPGDLLHGETNIQIGTWYLRYLLDEFNQDIPLTLASYNAGKSRVREWLSLKVWNGELSGMHQIPFPETRRYLTKVLRIHRIYRYLYS
jgi:soluble lytic murein transglycosylase